MPTYKTLVRTEIYETRGAVQIGNTVNYPLYRTGSYLEGGTVFNGLNPVFRNEAGGLLEPIQFVMIDRGKNNPMTGKFVKYKGLQSVNVSVYRTGGEITDEKRRQGVKWISMILIISAIILPFIFLKKESIGFRVLISVFGVFLALLISAGIVMAALPEPKQ